jgi:hypothetical protein
MALGFPLKSIIISLGGGLAAWRTRCNIHITLASPPPPIFSLSMTLNYERDEPGFTLQRYLILTMWVFSWVLKLLYQFRDRAG